MNLLEMLGGSLTEEASVNNIAKKSGSSNAQIIKLVGVFLPLVITLYIFLETLGVMKAYVIVQRI